MGARSSLSRNRNPLDAEDPLDLTTRSYVDATADTYLPVANGTHFNGNGGSTSTALPQGRLFETRKLLRVITGGADKLQVEWANIWTSNTPQAADATCEMAGPNSVTVRMGIEYPAGMMRMTSGSSAWNSATAYAINDQVTSGGSSWIAVAASTNSTPSGSNANWRLVRRYLVRWKSDDGAGTISFAAGDYKQSLPLQLTDKLLAGDMIAVLGSFDTGNTSNRVPHAGANGACNTAPFVDWVVTSTSAMAAAGSALADTGVTTQTNSNATTSNSTDFTAWTKISYATAITGNNPDKKCIALFGDSLIQGTGGDIRDGEPAGIFVRALDSTTWWRIAQGGNQASCYTLSNAPWQLGVVSRCSAVICNLGVNDIQAANNFATTQAKMLRVWKALAAQGIPVYTGPPAPISLSSDSWATTTNQSRWTTGGASAFPGDDATYLTSVYGQMAMWITQDGAVDALTSAKLGQANHPITGLLEWRSVMADSQTSWKWVAGYTSDGAHPKASTVAVQAPYLASQVGVLLSAGRLTPSFSVGHNPIGTSPIQVSDRSLVSTDLSPALNGSFMSVIGISPGRPFIGMWMMRGSMADASTRSWSFMIGKDAAKMKVVDSAAWGSNTSPDTMVPIAFASSIYVPAGYLMALQVVSDTTATASMWRGFNAPIAALNQPASNFLLAGTCADTTALSVNTIVSLYSGVKYTVGVFRAWAEMI